MKYVVVDLEMNNTSRKSGVSQFLKMETIEIGSVMLDENLQEIATFRTYIRPEYSDGIRKNISDLTGITNAMVAGAPGFREALRMFTTWCLGTGDEVKIYAWSDSDYAQISTEMMVKQYEIGDMEKALLEKRWEDFQKEFDSYLGFERQLSLSMALDLAGIDFKGREHDALDDARNTAELLQIFKDKGRFDETLKRIKEAMEPTKLECTLGDLFDFSNIICSYDRPEGEFLHSYAGF